MKIKNPIVVRVRDRALFESSFPDSMDGPVGTAAQVLSFLDALSRAPKYYFRHVVPVKRSFWFGYKLVRTGAIWEPTDESEFDVMEKRDVLRGINQ